MGDKRTDLPEGTDTIIDTDQPTDTALVTDTEIAVPTGDAGRAVTGSETPRTGLRDTDEDASSLIDRLRSGGESLTSQAGERARDLVSQGLGRSAEALANVSRLVGDTADGLDERLGPEFGDYARRAAGAIENVASTIAEKDADELIEDTRNFVRNSPGLAIAGAAILGFVAARLVKSGLSNRDEDDDA